MSGPKKFQMKNDPFFFCFMVKNGLQAKYKGQKYTHIFKK